MKNEPLHKGSTAPVLVIFIAGFLLTMVTSSLAFSENSGTIISPKDTVRNEMWHRLLSSLDVKLPDSLPPLSEDPSKPAIAHKRKNRVFYHDSTGRSYVRSDWGNWTNYKESGVGAYNLPDPLLLDNGKRVSDAETWWKQRRKQILGYYQNDIYGKIPSHTPTVKFTITNIDSGALHGMAISKTIFGHIDNSAYPKAHPEIQFKLYLPIKVATAVPVVVHIDESLKAYANTGIKNDYQKNPMYQVLKQGWGFAVFNTLSVQKDKAKGLKKGIIGLLNEGKSRKTDEWGTIAAWSWGLSRAVDYLKTDPSIDSKRLALQGHSRWGKTALVAAAYDKRWAMVYSSCSGAMGASLEKRNFGETIDNVAAAREFHWMSGSFIKYGGHWEKMPVDAHDLIALLAPRPVFITGGTHDLWSDPHGEFLACQAATPVYKLLGEKGLESLNMPKPGQALMRGNIAFREHVGGHTDIPDWPYFLRFAGHYFKHPFDRSISLNK